MNVSIVDLVKIAGKLFTAACLLCLLPVAAYAQHGVIITGPNISIGAGHHPHHPSNHHFDPRGFRPHHFDPRVFDPRVFGPKGPRDFDHDHNDSFGPNSFGPSIFTEENRYQPHPRYYGFQYNYVPAEFFYDRDDDYQSEYRGGDNCPEPGFSFYYDKHRRCYEHKGHFHCESY